MENHNPAGIQSKTWASRHPVATAILIVGAFIVIIGIVGAGSSNNTTAPTQSSPSVGTESNTQPVNLLALKSIRYYFNTLNEPCVNGEVTNISNQTLGFVQANIQFRDKTGSLITPDQTYLNVE